MLSSWGHRFDVMMTTAGSLSPDGKMLAAAALRGAGTKTVEVIEFWGLPEGKKLAKVLDWPKDKEPTDQPLFPVVQLSFSPDGRRLAGVRHHAGREIVVWELETGEARILARVKKDIDPWISFSPDGRWLAHPATEKTVTLRDLGSNASVEVTFPLPVIGPAAVGPDCGLLAAPCRTREDSRVSVVVWDVAARAEKTRFGVRSAGLVGEARTALAFRPGGKELAVSDGLAIVVVDPLEGVELVRIESGHWAGVHVFGWHPDGRHLVSAGGEGALRIWELSEAPPQESLPAAISKLMPYLDAPFTGRAFDLAFSPDGRWVAVGPGIGDAGVQVQLLDRATGTLRRQFHCQGTGQVLFSEDSRRLAAVNGGQAVVWEIDSGKEMVRLETKDFAAPTAAAFDAAGHLHVIRRHKDKVVVWDVTAGRASWESPADPTSQFFLGPQGRLLVGMHTSPDDKSEITMQEVPSGRTLSRLPFGEGMPVLPYVSGNGHWLAVSYLSLPGREARRSAPALKPIESAVRLWRLPSGDKPCDIRAKALPVAQALSPDNRYLAIGYSDDSAALWDLASAEEVLRLHTSLRLITHVAFAPDGSALALCDVQSPPRIIQVSDLRRQLAKLGLDW